MSVKAYTKYTLNGNWFEERAQPLKGVIADYGFNETTTTTKTTHRRPAKDAQFQRLIAKPRIRCGMVTPDTLAEARISWAGGESAGPGFGALVQTHAAGELDRHMMSTTMAAYGAAPKETVFEKKRKERAQQPAGGSAPVPKGLRGSGATGEVFKDDADPQSNTRVQRAWLYSKDPMIKAREADTSYMSLTVKGDKPPVTGKLGRHAKMTLTQDELSRRAGVNIWADEIH